ncbi:uncharacterized protein TNIN_268081 [Trichonephila inaurata madagascariensis]|uniref:Uncharacterized protein n=1 Tax=Trichonephila inaurata madagascariensis TaxID=2747483 RepID=A0A8X6XR25_9ARAC|nr:uncharacterized protein TNIN_268081 [Trichonephila inaurata madagascariensis]
MIIKIQLEANRTIYILKYINAMGFRNYEVEHLITPERGVVNFNTLHLLLRRILKETGIGKRTVKYKYPDADAFLRRLLEGGEISSTDLEVSSEEHLESDEVILKTDDFEDTSTNTDSDVWPGAEFGDLFTTVNELEKKLEKVIRQMEKIEMNLAGTVRKIKYDDGEKRERKTESDINRDEFEEALEEIGEAIARLGNKLKLQEGSQGESINEEILKKMCLEAAEEEIAKRQAVFTQGLQQLAIAVRNLQYIIKEIINPEAAGITK